MNVIRTSTLTVVINASQAHARVVIRSGAAQLLKSVVKIEENCAPAVIPDRALHPSTLPESSFVSRELSLNCNLITVSPALSYTLALAELECRAEEAPICGALALGLGAGSELRRPLGIAVVGGLLVSQLLTLYTTPVIFLFMERARNSLVGRIPKYLGMLHLHLHRSSRGRV